MRDMKVLRMSLMLDTKKSSVVGSANWIKKICQVDGRGDECDAFDSGRVSPFILSFPTAAKDILLCAEKGCTVIRRGGDR